MIIEIEIGVLYEIIQSAKMSLCIESSLPKYETINVYR